MNAPAGCFSSLFSESSCLLFATVNSAASGLLLRGSEPGCPRKNLEETMFTLIAKWTIKQGQERAAIAALKRLAKQVEQEEDTLIYLVHVPDMSQESLPTPSNLEVVFFEAYKNKAAFLAHVCGPIFKKFVAENIDLFLFTTSACQDGENDKNPFVLAEFLSRKAGFIRPEAMATKR
jgi:quinol monooxygenase YgiN